MHASDFLKAAIYGAIVADTRAGTAYAPIILETNDSIRIMDDEVIDVNDLKNRFIC